MGDKPEDFVISWYQGGEDDDEMLGITDDVTFMAAVHSLRKKDQWTIDLRFLRKTEICSCPDRKAKARPHAMQRILVGRARKQEDKALCWAFRRRRGGGCRGGW